MEIDLDKQAVQAIGVIALLVVLVLLIRNGMTDKVAILITALLTKLGLSEGYTLVQKIK